MTDRNNPGYSVYEGEELKKLQKMMLGTASFSGNRPNFVGAVVSTSKMVLAIIF